MTIASPKNLDDKMPMLLDEAWRVRDLAYIIGPTRVGCSILDEDGNLYVGCNVEHRFRSHDIHAEVNAVSSMIAAGGRKIIALVVVAERERFTPCGACMDWIMQFCEDDCLIIFQPKRGAPLHRYRASELMPHYPK